MMFKRAFSSNIGQVFINENVQKLLKDMTRYDETKIFGRRVVNKLRTPKFVFMTDNQLKKAKEDAYGRVEAKLQMPPVLPANNSEPEVLARDEEIVGYTKFKILFIDIGSGYTNKSRLMSVREPDGTLRYPNHSERSRLNHMFFPDKTKTIDPPKLFEKKHLMDLLKRKEYVYVLNRACVQFEPDDPRYVDVTTQVYEYINDKSDFDKLRSTRHFGPMCFYLAYTKKSDNLSREMLTKGLEEDAAKLSRLNELLEELHV